MGAATCSLPRTEGTADLRFPIFGNLQLTLLLTKAGHLRVGAIGMGVAMALLLLALFFACCVCLVTYLGQCRRRGSTSKDTLYRHIARTVADLTAADKWHLIFWYHPHSEAAMFRDLANMSDMLAKDATA